MGRPRRRGRRRRGRRRRRARRTHAPRAIALIPVAIALGLAVVALAVTRFELFVASILLVRASLDAADLGPAALDAAGALSVLFVGASAIWLLAQRSQATMPSPTAPLIPPVTALFACALLSVTVSAHPLDSLFEVVRFGTLIVIVSVLGRLIRSGQALRLVLIAAIGSSIVPVLFAIRQITGQGGVFTASGLDRVRGTFLHSNPFAAYLFLMITLIVSIYPHVERRWRLVLVPLVLACGGSLIATYSRGAWAATVVALVVIGVLQDRRILWLLGGLIVVVALAVPSVGVRLSDLSETQKETGAPGNSLIWRFEYWREVLALQDNPVIGIGFKEVELNLTAAKAPHNDPIRIFVETGIVGLRRVRVAPDHLGGAGAIHAPAGAPRTPSRSRRRVRRFVQRAPPPQPDRQRDHAARDPLVLRHDRRHGMVWAPALVVRRHRTPPAHEDPARQQVPVPTGRRGGLHARSRVETGSVGARGRVLRHPASREPVRARSRRSSRSTSSSTRRRPRGRNGRGPPRGSSTRGPRRWGSLACSTGSGRTSSTCTTSTTTSRRRCCDPSARAPSRR